MLHRINRKLIDRILDEEDAVEAIGKLSQYNVPRDWKHPDLGLSRPERNVYLFCWYAGEVGNGGHVQLFLNPSGGYATRMLDALEEMGLFDLREILGEACSIFPGPVPADQDERERVIGDLPEEALVAWRRLDRRLWDHDLAAYKPVLEYLRRHRSEILAPETA